jgi:hypothetical protein
MKCSIVIISSPKYHIFSPVCFKLIDKYINNHLNLEVYYINSDENCSLDYNNITNIIIKENGDNFINRLYNGLKNIDSEYILLILEDFWFKNNFLDKESFYKIMNTCKKYDLDQIKLYDMRKIDKEQMKDNDIIFNDDKLSISWAGGCNFPVSHYPTIFKKSWLLNNLKECISDNRKTTGEHEGFNNKYIHFVKKNNNDNKNLKIAHISFCNLFNNDCYNATCMNTCGNGKFGGYSILYDHINEINECKKLLEILPSTDFIRK